MHRSLLAAAAAAATLCASPSFAATLVGFAFLPADTFAEGPPSGNGAPGAGPITGNGRDGPFPGQPVQGFSAILPSTTGAPNRFLAMADNGYGAKANSGDFLLRAYDITIDFRTATGGTGNVSVNSFLQMRDPNAVIDFALTRPDRLLTGSDFDPESLRRLSDGTYYVGEEFGPFLLRLDADFRVIGDPIPVPGVISPDNPFGGTVTLPGSGGFEGMALSPDGNTLYPMLEKAVAGDNPLARRIYDFNIADQSFDGYSNYLLDNASNAIGDFTSVGGDRYVVIERDNGQGPTALFKKLFLVDFSERDAAGNLIKTELADLLNVADPDDLNADGSSLFTFPFQTIEEVLFIDQNTLLVGNDNNYPFSNGRFGPAVPDPNEFLLIRLDAPLPVPEPATWAMMIGGIGLAGASLRVRRKTAAIA